MRRRHLLATPAVLWLAGCAAPPAAPADTRRDWFIFLETGRPTPKGTPEAQASVQAMQRGHIDNFKRLHGEKKLFAAGPLRDPSGFQRGMVVVKANTRDELLSYFQPDEYVRDGYMTVNAAPAIARRRLISEGIDPNGIEEVRIVKIARGSAAVDAATEAARRALLQQRVDEGRFGAWYTLQEGPVAEILFARSTDTAGLQAALAGYPGLGQAGVEAQVWSQWIGKRVVPGEFP
jgi:uncharacterized protein YciI